MAQILNGTYEILELAGKGGMSTVFKARHIRLNKMVAVKSVRKDQPFDMQAEVDILTKLEHPNLVRVLDVFEDERLIYIVMDFIEGEDLQHVIRREKVISEDTLKDWFITLADILNYLHSRKPPIIYRDMKPANVILQKDGKLKLVDFGIAREYKAAASSDTTYAGSRGFAAPEQFGMAQSDGRTDIYSLGMTMYYLATGKSPLEPPYNYIPARQLNPDLSEKMEKILEKCIRFNPDERYQSAAELLDDLRSQKTRDTKPKKHFGLTIALVLIAALLGTAFMFRDRIQFLFTKPAAEYVNGEDTVTAETQEPETPGSVPADGDTAGSVKEDDKQNHDIGLIASSWETPFVQYCNAELYSQFSEDIFGDHKYTLDSAESGNSMDQQLELVDRFISEGKEVLIIDLVDATRADEVISKAAAADIPVIFFNNEPVEKDGTYEYLNRVDYDKVCYIGTDSYEAGRCQGRIVAALSDHGDINGDGRVSYMVFRRGPDNEYAYLRAMGAENALYDAGIEGERIAEVIGDWDEQEAQEACTKALQEYGSRIEVIFCSDDILAIGASKALDTVGLAPGEDIYLLGIGDAQECLELIEQGGITGTVSFDIGVIPDRMVQLITQMVTETPEILKYINVDCVPVTD